MSFREASQMSGESENANSRIAEMINAVLRVLVDLRERKRKTTTSGKRMRVATPRNETFSTSPPPEEMSGNKDDQEKLLTVAIGSINVVNVAPT